MVSSPTHTGTPTCCCRGASPWVHQPAPCLPPSCPCKDDARGSGWLPALPRVGVSEQLLSAAYLQAPRSDSPLHYQPYTGTGFRSPKHPEVKMKVLVAKLGLTLCDPMDCSPPGSSVHARLQAKILERGAVPFSKRSA